MLLYILFVKDLLVNMIINMIINVLYEGIRYEAEMNVASIGEIIWKDVTNRGN